MVDAETGGGETGGQRAPLGVGALVKDLAGAEGAENDNFGVGGGDGGDAGAGGLGELVTWLGIWT